MAHIGKPVWDRGFYAQRFDEPLHATAVISQSIAAIIMPPVGAQDRLQALGERLAHRLRRPHLGPREHR